MPLEHEQLAAGAARGAGGACRLDPRYAGHDRLLPLADPSLHTNTLPSQCEIPPFLTEQGLFWALAGAAKKAKAKSRATAFSLTRPLRYSRNLPTLCDAPAEVMLQR